MLLIAGCSSGAGRRSTPTTASTTVPTHAPSTNRSSFPSKDANRPLPQRSPVTDGWSRRGESERTTRPRSPARALLRGMRCKLYCRVSGWPECDEQHLPGCAIVGHTIRPTAHDDQTDLFVGGHTTRSRNRSGVRAARRRSLRGCGRRAERGLSLTRVPRAARNRSVRPRSTACQTRSPGRVKESPSMR
jgi:hypothetical protein